MDKAHLDEIREAVREQITITVNGKIDKLNTKVDNLISDFSAYKEENQPMTDLFKAANTGRKAVIWISTTLAAVGTIYYSIKKFF